MPRSRSRSVLSIARSATRSLARKVPLWCSSASTSVVLPWSTCAMMATLRRSGLATSARPPALGRGSVDEGILSVYRDEDAEGAKDAERERMMADLRGPPYIRPRLAAFSCFDPPHVLFVRQSGAATMPAGG